jgi:enoyl-CoA hydratase
MTTTRDATARSVHLDVNNDGVATVVVDRPQKLNALSLELLAQLGNAIREVNESEARVLILRTGGDRVFCVGADIMQFSTFTPVQMWNTWIAEGHRVFRQLANLRQPTIALIDGLALGGGLELALACDFRIATDTARLGLPEVGIGTIPGWGGTERLTGVIGAARAKQLILAGRQITADTALEWGLLTEVVDAPSLENSVSELVADILRGAPIAQQTAKQLIHAASQGADSALLEAIASGFTTATKDFQKGMDSFREKKPAQFSGE